MKNILLLFALFATTNIINAQTNSTTAQNEWRWRKDDGNETSATWKAAINTPVTAIVANNVLRLRIALTVTTGGTSGNEALNDVLQYTTNPSDPNSWTDINPTGSNAFILSNSSNKVPYPTQTTQQITTSNPNTFIDGECVINYDKTQYVSKLGVSGNHTEIEWFITVTSSAALGTTYYFREHGTTCNCTPAVATGYPSLTMSGVLPVKLTSFTLSSLDKKIKLDWTTAMEQSNARFDILRSSDSKNWKTIASVKGHGTTNLSNNYQIYDANPLNGTNYYQLKQFDLDGNFYLSEIKALNSSSAATKDVVSISPNPAHGSITFSTTASYNNVNLALNNVNGSIIYRETITSLNSNAINKLKMQKLPAPGIYILTLKAAGLSEAHKVIIY